MRLSLWFTGVKMTLGRILLNEFSFTREKRTEIIWLAIRLNDLKVSLSHTACYKWLLNHVKHSGLWVELTRLLFVVYFVQKAWRWCCSKHNWKNIEYWRAVVEHWILGLHTFVMDYQHVNSEHSCILPQWSNIAYFEFMLISCFVCCVSWWKCQRRVAEVRMWYGL